MSPAKPNTRKRPRGEGAVFQRCDTERGCPPREPVLNDDGTPILAKSGNPKMARPPHKKCRGLWVARLDLGYGADGKPNRPQRTSATRSGALDKLIELKEQLIKYGDVPRHNITVEQWLNKWIEEFVKPKNGPGTYANDKSRINVHLNPGIGNHRLERLQPQHLRDLYKHMKDNGKLGMRPGVHRTIHKALNDAMSEGLVVRNVASLVAAPGGKGTKRQALTAAEGREYIKHVHGEDEHGNLVDRFASRWVMALLTGARQGECLGLELDRVDLKKRTMDVAWQLRRVHFSHGCGDGPGDSGRWPCGRKRAGACPERFFDLPDEYECRQLDGGLCLVRPKSEAGIRMLPIPTPLHADLVVHLETDTGPNPHGLVWRESDGSPIDGTEDRARWSGNLKAAGLPPVVLHEAKHTTVTLLMEAGVDPEIIKAIAGHSSLAVQEGYKHVNIQHMADALGHVAGTLYREEVEH